MTLDNETAVSTYDASEDPNAIRYVNAYSVTRHYGGPEEGGWWYNAGEPLASVPLLPGEDPAPVIARLQAIFSGEEYGDIYSVRGGIKVSVGVAYAPAERFPSERPHYE